MLTVAGAVEEVVAAIAAIAAIVVGVVYDGGVGDEDVVVGVVFYWRGPCLYCCRTATVLL